MIKSWSHEQILRRIGGWYLIRLIAMAQLIALVGAIPGILSIWVNAEFDQQQVRTFSLVVPVLILVTFVVLLGISRQMTPTVRKKLDRWADDTIRLKPEDEFLAWREITSLGWRYGIAAVIAILILDVIPLFLMSLSKGEILSSAFQPTDLHSPTAIYVLMGGIVSLFGSVITAVLMIERFVLPIRLILLPKDFETQLKAQSGLLLNGKFLLLSLGLIGIAILLIAPIGFQHMIRRPLWRDQFHRSLSGTAAGVGSF